MNALRLTGSRCLCRGCGQLFNSEFAFEKHRVGSPLGRRCLGPVELSELDMTQNAAGFWVSRVMPTHRARAVTREIPADLRATPLPSQRGAS